MLDKYDFSYVWNYPKFVELTFVIIVMCYLKSVPLVYLSKIGLTVYLSISA